VYRLGCPIFLYKQPTLPSQYQARGKVGVVNRNGITSRVVNHNATEDSIIDRLSQIIPTFATVNNAVDMPISTDDHIVNRIKNHKSQRLFFVDDFVDIGSYKAVSKALERLVEKDKLIRVAIGIYARYKEDPVFGVIYPTTEQIAEAIAKRDKARIIPTGSYALHALGLSTQIPLNVVYLTDGTARKIKVGNRTIQFKKTTPKNLAAKGKISSLVIQALKVIGKDKVTEDEKRKILELLKREKITDLEHDIRLAPEWIRKIMKQAISK